MLICWARALACSTALSYCVLVLGACVSINILPTLMEATHTVPLVLASVCTISQPILLSGLALYPQRCCLCGMT